MRHEEANSRRAVVTMRAPMLRSPRLPWILSFLTAVAATGVFCFQPLDETDAGWHLSLGRIIMSHGLPSTNSLAWTQGDHPFYATSWLFDVACYGAMHALGMLGLQLFTFLLIALTLGLVTVAGSRVSQHGWWVPLTIAWLVVPRVTPRPHMVSWALLAACLALCLPALQAGWKQRAAVIPLIAIGSNCHAGAMFTSIALGAFCADAALRERKWVREAAIAALGFAALTVNPGGPYNVIYVLTHLSLYKIVPIKELQTPALTDLPAFWILIIPAVALAWLNREKERAMVLNTAGFALMGAFAARLAFKFDLVAAVPLAAGVERLAPRTRRLAIAAFMVLAFSTNIFRYTELHLAPEWDAHVNPVRALAFIRANGLNGRYYNSFNDGGFLAWEAPDLPIFQDGRALAYSHEFFVNQLKCEHDPECFDALLRQLGVEWALTTSTNNALTGDGLLQGPGWALVYWDDYNELRVRRDIPRLQPLLAQEFMHLRPDRDFAAIFADLRHAPDDEAARAKTELERLEQAGVATELRPLVECALAQREPAVDASACVAARQRWPQIVGP
jgi:hypothetical protein